MSSRPKKPTKSQVTLEALTRTFQVAQRQIGELWDNLYADGPETRFNYRVAGEALKIAGMVRSLDNIMTDHTNRLLKAGRRHKSATWVDNARIHGAELPWRLPCPCLECKNQREMEETRGDDEEIDELKRQVQHIVDYANATWRRERELDQNNK